MFESNPKIACKYNFTKKSIILCVFVLLLQNGKHDFGSSVSIGLPFWTYICREIQS